MPSPEQTVRDIEGWDDLLQVMTDFYGLMLSDDELRPIFVDVARIQLDEHLPVLADFWEGILFGTSKYRNNPMAVHLDLHRKHALTPRHFELWLGYLNKAVDEGFQGPVAFRMKERALSIATVMQIKIAQTEGAV